VRWGVGIALAGLAAAGGLVAGYWLGGRGRPTEPGVRASTAVNVAPAPGERRILYYRNPMGLPDISPEPKKDPMGMSYIPVYEGEEDASPEASGTVRIGTERVQRLGVRTEPAARRDLSRVVRALGLVEANERLTYKVAPRFEGWIERLHVNTTGQPVKRGEPLLEAYSPELVSTQNEYVIAFRGQRALAEALPGVRAGVEQLAGASLARLRNWEIGEETLQELRRTGQPRHTLTYRAPVDGIVLEKMAVQGMRFMPGEALYVIVDLSSVWVMTEVYEQDLALVQTGQAARVMVDAYPERSFEGQVSYVYPTLNPQTRTAPVRLELANPDGLLKPGMYARVAVAARPDPSPVLTVPTSAVIDSGRRQLVLVELAEGRFEPREVRLGLRGDDYVEVREGIGEGERVVVTANFLIDAESNLKAAVAGFGAGGASAAPAAAPPVHAGH
jgi:Cu(I)/Ag(I) efflux system membrane fusion protein